ncbi:MAG: hypothetical protein FJW14_01125 [Acidimicrobiia bacterium]|nr:hypothetical protein [Acidimicrobiia bacterium]
MGGARRTPRAAGPACYRAQVQLLPQLHVWPQRHPARRPWVEYDFPRFRLGAGYGAYQSRGAVWQHKPFVTATVKVPPVGNVELWLQRLHDNHLTAQIRFAKVFVH